MTVYPANLHPPSCDVAGHLHSGIAGVPGEVEISARDRFGNRLMESGGALCLTILPMDDTRAQPIEGTFVDHADGRYSGVYTVALAGRHALSLTTADGAPLQGSPYLLHIVPAAASAQRCAVLVARRHLAAAADDDHDDDHDGDDHDHDHDHDGGGRAAVATHHAASTAAAAARPSSAKGSRRQRVREPAAAAAAAAVTPATAAPRRQAPRTSPRSTGAASCAPHRAPPSSARGAAQSAARVRMIAGGDVTLGLRVADAFGNATAFDPTSLEVSIDDVSVAASAGALAPDAEFSVRALPQRYADDASMARAVNGGGGSGANRAAGGAAGGAAGAAAATAAVAAARWGVQASPHAGVAADAAGAACQTSAAVASSDGAGGSGVLLVRVYRAGDHLVRVRLGSIELPGSPVALRVAPTDVSARHSYIAHDAHYRTPPNLGLHGASTASSTGGAAAARGAPATTGDGGARAHAVTVLTSDGYGNPLTTGGAAVSAKMSGPGASATRVEDHHNGSYTVTWSAALSGAHRLSVLLSGGHVKGSPFNVWIEMPTPASPRAQPSSPSQSPRTGGADSPRSCATAAARSTAHSAGHGRPPAAPSTAHASPAAIASHITSSCVLSPGAGSTSSTWHAPVRAWR